MTLLDLSSFASPGALVLGPPATVAGPTLINVSGTTLLCEPTCTPAAADAALKSLRGFRAAGRRVAWCHPAELAHTPHADLRTWGRKLVDLGGAQVVVACGTGSRELALAARDAGLPLGRVVVCRDEATARNVLCDSIHIGDTILALGTTAESCYKLAERLESRFERELAVSRL